MMIQDKIFELSEADNWFLRNKEAIISKEIKEDLISGLIDRISNKDEFASVIELGSSNGYRLQFLKRILPNCKKFVGVEASKMAVEDGISRYGLEMYHSTLDVFNSMEKFDIVIVNFVYHWIDRENIFKAIANTDKLLNDGGYLIVGDFLPDFPQKRKYHHLPEESVYTYKIDYSAVFESLNTYKEIYKTTFNHDNAELKHIEFSNSDKRGFCSILRKDLYGHYQQV